MVCGEGLRNHAQVLIHHRQVGVHQTRQFRTTLLLHSHHFLETQLDFRREPDIVLVRESNPSRHTIMQAGHHEILKVSDQPFPMVGIGYKYQTLSKAHPVALQDCKRVIRRPVIADEEAEILVGLGQQRIELGTEILRPVVRSQQHIHQR